jgi:hypothetical protein
MSRAVATTWLVLRARALRFVVGSHLTAALMARLLGLRLLRCLAMLLVTRIMLPALLLALAILIAFMPVIGLLLAVLALAREVALRILLTVLRMRLLIAALLVAHKNPLHHYCDAPRIAGTKATLVASR